MPNSGVAAGPQSGSATLGRSVVITGELKASEDLAIEGHLEGTIELRQNSVTIGQSATIKGEIFGYIRVSQLTNCAHKAVS